MKQPSDGTKLVAANPKARHDYEILNTFEAGLELQGAEVKSVRSGGASIKEAYVIIRAGQAFLIGAHITPYEQAGGIIDPTRTRKLLLHKKELDQLAGVVQTKGQTIVPLRLYLKRGFVKLEIGLARGKQLHDKRASLKADEQAREAAKAVRDFEKP